MIKVNPDRDSLLLRFLYEWAAGRAMLKLMTSPVVSIVGGRFLDTALSSLLIDGYVRRNKIDLRRFEKKRYRSFNDFFTRRVRSAIVYTDILTGKLMAPCDGKLSHYRITKGSTFHIKNSDYSIMDLIGDEKLAQVFDDGDCLIFRLTPDDYHRYHFIDSGKYIFHRRMEGRLHTVRPIAQVHLPVFVHNTREASVFQTRYLQIVAQVEVGAMMVGKINNHKHTGVFCAGEEKGFFEFGGSTIILLLQKGVAGLRGDIKAAALQDREIPVRAGEVIGACREREGK